MMLMAAPDIAYTDTPSRTSRTYAVDHPMMSAACAAPAGSAPPGGSLDRCAGAGCLATSCRLSLLLLHELERLEGVPAGVGEVKLSRQPGRLLRGSERDAG